MRKNGSGERRCTDRQELDRIYKINRIEEIVLAAVFSNNPAKILLILSQKTMRENCSCELWGNRVRRVADLLETARPRAVRTA